MQRYALAAAVACGLGLVSASSQAATVTLSGTIRDFCAPSIGASGPLGACSHLSDFEGAIPGVVTGMVASALGPTGLPVYIGGGSGATTDANFAYWYVDSPGINVAKPFSLDLTETVPGSGTFSFGDSTFFPIDGDLYGNQGRSHNYHFTLHLEGLLSFSDPTPGADKTFSFTGDDDLWIFVDGKLVIDLGGVHGAVGASFTEETLKGLGLVAGTDYALDIFFAERHTSDSNFFITTNLDISAPGAPEPASLALLGLGLAGLAAARRRRR